METKQGTRIPISVRGLTKRYGSRIVVDDLSFDVEAGTVTGFLGPNGAGKSTTMRAVVGLVEPDGGEARVLGQRYVDLREPARVLGTLLDAAYSDPRRTGRQHLRLLARAIDVDLAKADQVLRLTDLTDAADRRISGYSLGMRQRLALAGALLGSPKVLMLDEPANGLDPAGIRWLRRSLKTFAAHGGTAFVSSHVLSEVSQLADHLIVIDRGRLVARGATEELTRGETDLERVFFDLLAKGA
ncbi:MAG TPA: ATP-binding cassette domain-containing protein [Actinomycetota bacterium]|nr:ATP-binding cassette domain-containing protein [Actinomycetota bacterium]